MFDVELNLSRHAPIFTLSHKYCKAFDILSPHYNDSSAEEDVVRSYLSFDDKLFQHEPIKK